jgi:hypothetical protein
MQALVKAFWEIALWRRSPADLPDSAALLAASALAYAALSAAQSWLLFGTTSLVGRTLADLALLALPLWLLLALARRRPRYRQTLTALFGTGAVLSPFVILLLAFKAPAESSYPLALLVWGGSVGVVLWYLFVIGFILRAALDTGMFTGMAIALAYVAGSSALLSTLFPGSP